MLSKRHYFLVAVVVLLAIAGSLLLIPGSREIALMQMKDRHFDEARTAYEKDLAASAMNLEVANNLSDLYIQKGDIKKAIGIMEKFVSGHQDNLQARIKLGKLYQYDQRNDDFMRNLEAINRLHPDSENLSTLSDMYNFKGDYDKQEQALKNLIAYQKGIDPKNFSDLANIQASRHDFTGAISTLHDLKKSDPDHFTFANETLLVSILLDNHQPDDALDAAEEWLNQHENAEEASELINLLHYKGNVVLGKKLMNRFSDEKIDANPKLLEASVMIKLSENKDDEVYEHLTELYKAKKLPSSLTGDLLLLTVERGDQKMTHQIMKEVPLTILPEDQILRLVESAIVQEDNALLSYITETFRSDDARRLYPVISAALAVANQASDAPALLSRLDSLGFSHEQTLEIASICAHFNRSECAAHLLGNMPDASKLSDNEIATAGDVYLQLREPEKGYAYISKALESHHTRTLDIVSVRFAAARGKTQEVQSWLAKHPDLITPRVLIDLFFAAYDNNKHETAIHVARFFRDKYNSDNARSLLASAYIGSGQYESAVVTLREISHKDQLEEDEDNYLYALSKLGMKHAGYRNELVGYATTRLKSHPLPDKQRLNILHALIDVNETDVAMPYFKAEALASGGEWLTVYAELLDKKGMHDEATKYWVKALKDPNNTMAKKEDIAYVLLDHGDKMDAEPVFAEIARNADARSAAVGELLYVWGPKPSAEHMRWLEKRYSQASGDEKRRWASIIGDYGSAEYIEGFVTRHPETVNVPEVADSYFDVLAQEGKLEGKSSHYLETAKHTGSTAILNKYASVAADAGLKKDARQSYEELLKMDPNNPILQRQTGMAAYEQADYTSAKKYLGQYIKSYNANAFNDPKAYLAYFYYADMLRKDEDKQGAVPYYKKALALMGSTVPATPEDINVKVESQVFSGNKQAGIATMKEALQQYPGSSELRANMADFLMETGDYDQAGELLKPPAKGTAPKGKIVTSADLPVLSTPIKSYVVYRDNHELLITFARPVSLNDINKLRNLPWVAYTSDGYDTVLVATLPEYKFHIDSNKLHLGGNNVSNGAPGRPETLNLAGASQ